MSNEVQVISNIAVALQSVDSKHAFFLQIQVI